MPTAPISVLVVDDERLARERLRVLLSGESNLQVVGECENGLEALAAITSMAPELVLLDVQMPELDGLGVIDALHDAEMPEIVFVTAHDAYMERAFEIHAVDYLRKPYTNARFMSALDQARRRVHARRAEREMTNAPADSTAAAQPSRYSAVLASVASARRDRRLAVQDAATGTWHIVQLEDIDWIQADGPARVRVKVGSESFQWRKTLSDVERALDPHVFVRVHRSFIVNVGHIRHVKPIQKGEFTLFLHDGSVLDTGRTYRDAIENLLGTGR